MRLWAWAGASTSNQLRLAGQTTHDQRRFFYVNFLIMLNIDDRLFSECTESEFWLMCHIAKRMSKEMSCFPANKLLCTDTDWSLSKLQEVKKSCIKKGLIQSHERRNEAGQTSNIYTIETNYLSVHVNLKGKGGATPLSDSTIPPARFYHTPLSDFTIPPCQILGNEVLTNEVLTNEPNIRVSENLKNDFPNPLNTPLTVKEEEKKKVPPSSARPPKKEKTGRVSHTWSDTLAHLQENDPAMYMWAQQTVKIWEDWMEYRIENKKCTPYGSAKTEYMAIKKLHSMAEGKENNAKAIVEHCRVNGYQGLYLPTEMKQRPAYGNQPERGVNPYSYG